MNTDKTMESRLNSILWKNTDPADTSARPMRKELADELLSFLKSELALREQEIVDAIKMVDFPREIRFAKYRQALLTTITKKD